MDFSNPLEIQLRLMAVAYYFGDFSNVYHFVNRNTPIYNAFAAKDVNMLKGYVEKIDTELLNLSAEQQQQLNAIQEEISNEYKSQLSENPLPLPESFFEKLSDRATRMGNYTTAHSAWAAIDKLEKGVNLHLVRGVEFLQSKELKSDTEGVDEHVVDQKIEQAAQQFYHAIRIKKPLGNEFQYLSHDLFFKDHESLRKYFRYVEQSLMKEIIEFCIHYLVDDKTISAKIVDNLNSGKIRKFFLLHLAQLFSNGKENYLSFMNRYREAVRLFKDAKKEDQFLAVQKTLLGRGTGDDEFRQYLRELAVEHPISTPLIAITPAADNLTIIPIIAPIVLKSGASLAEFLELDKES